MEKTDEISNFYTNNKLDLEKVIKKYTRYVYSIIKAKVPNIKKEDAEEVISDVLLIIWKNKNKLDRKSKFSPYIAGVTKNVLYRKYKEIRDNIKNVEHKYDEEIEGNFDVNKIRNYMQIDHKKDFPYLSGNKLCNYWMYVIYQYTNINYINREALTIAPDIHVLRSSVKLEIITQKEFESSNAQILCINNWNEILKGTKFAPIDIHTPLWLWGRSGFKEI